MIKLQIKPLTVAITSAIMFASLQSYAAPGDGTGDGGGQSDNTGVENPYVETNAKRVKVGYPLGDMAQWLAAPGEYALNPINIRGGRHPDRENHESFSQRQDKPPHRLCRGFSRSHGGPGLSDGGDAI